MILGQRVKYGISNAVREIRFTENGVNSQLMKIATPSVCQDVPGNLWFEIMIFKV